MILNVALGCTTSELLEAHILKAAFTALTCFVPVTNTHFSAG
jgi:hypothetical protein